MRISDWSSDVCSSDLEFKGQDGFVFTPECAHWFASNYLPVSRDTTRGFIRRWLVLDFNHPIREEDKIENLAQILVAEERGAIAAWALEGLHRLLDNRDYTTPSCHEQRLAQMRRIRSEEHTSELQSLMRITYAVFCLQKKK